MSRTTTRLKPPRLESWETPLLFSKLKDSSLFMYDSLFITLYTLLDSILLLSSSTWIDASLPKFLMLPLMTRLNTLDLLKCLLSDCSSMESWLISLISSSSSPSYYWLSESCLSSYDLDSSALFWPISIPCKSVLLAPTVEGIISFVIILCPYFY